jgi:putative transcriptional regulator
MKKSILKIVHNSAKGLYNAGLINKETLREFDAKCILPVNNPNLRKVKKINKK